MSIEKSYDDIINLPHHVSKTRKQMAISDRAAQFAPFAALTGHDAAVRETARLTERRIELDENAKAKLDEKLQYISSMLELQPRVSITYFVPDEKKSGGRYNTVNDFVRRIDTFDHIIIMADGTIIPMGEITDIDGELFNMVDSL